MNNSVHGNFDRFRQSSAKGIKYQIAIQQKIKVIRSVIANDLGFRIRKVKRHAKVLFEVSFQFRIQQFRKVAYEMVFICLHVPQDRMKFNRTGEGISNL